MVVTPADAEPAEPDRPMQARGWRRRESLISAGAELLAEGGWGALTSRAVAERAGVRHAHVHYYFGSQSSLKHAVVAAAVEDVFEPALEAMRDSSTLADGVAAVVRSIEEMTTAQARLSAELVAASLSDHEVAQLMQAALARFRSQLAPWVASVAEAEPQGVTTLITALLDGLVIHRLIDPALPLDRVEDALRHGGVFTS